MAAWASPEDYARYCPGGSLSGAELAAMLERASGQVDAICFGRIRRAGFENLTAFQRERIAEAVCRHAEFLATYSDALESPLASYGINGVSMAFDAGRMTCQGGVTAGREVYSLLTHRGIW